MEKNQNLYIVSPLLREIWIVLILAFGQRKLCNRLSVRNEARELDTNER